MSNNTEYKNVFSFRIPYEIFIVAASIFFLGLLNIIYDLSQRLKIAHEGILRLQKRLDHISTTFDDLTLQNKQLLNSFTKLNDKYQALDTILSDLRSENSQLTQTITDLNANLSASGSYSPILNSGTLLKLILGLVGLGIITYGGYSLVTIIQTKFANSSIGLLFAGIDRNLIWLGEKTRLISRPNIEQILIDDFANSFKVHLQGDEVVSILIETNEGFIAISNHLRELYALIDRNQGIIDVLNSRVSDAVVTVAANPNVEPAMTFIDNVNRFASMGI